MPDRSSRPSRTRAGTAFLLGWLHQSVDAPRTRPTGPPPAPGDRRVIVVTVALCVLVSGLVGAWILDDPWGAVPGGFVGLLVSGPVGAGALAVRRRVRSR